MSNRRRKHVNVDLRGTIRSEDHHEQIMREMCRRGTRAMQIHLAGAKEGTAKADA